MRTASAYFSQGELDRRRIAGGASAFYRILREEKQLKHRQRSVPPVRYEKIERMGDLHIVSLSAKSAETPAIVEVGLLPYTVVVPAGQDKA